MGTVTLTYDLDAITAAARDELDHENFRELVESRKAQLRKYDSAARWWHALFPWVITINRREAV